MIFLKRLLGAVLAGAVWGTAISGLSLATAQPAVTEGVFSIGIPSAESSVPAEGGRAMLPTPSPAQVQAVWDLGAAGNWASASRLLESLEAPGAGWTAPPDLRAYVSNGQRDARIAAMLEAKDWTAALKLLPAAGRDPCAAPFRLWARAEATEGLGAPDDIRTFYISTLNNCSDRALAAALADRSLLLLDADGLASVRETASLQDAGDPEMASVSARVLRAENRKRFDAAAGQGDLAAVARLANGSDDAFLLTQAGWVLLEPDTAASAGYFERALALDGESDARRGLIMAHLAAGDIPAARAAIAQAADTAALFRLSARADLAEAADRRDNGDWMGALELAARAAETDASLSADAQSFTGAALLAAASDAYDQGVYDRAAVLARQASDYPSEQRAGLMRAAWADYQRGDAAGSAAAFSRLYVESADAESAEGFALAAEKSGDLDSAAAIARRLGGPLGAKVNARYAAAAFNGGDYLTARTYAPDTYDSLEGVDRPWYRQAVAVRSQSGTSGENRLSGAVATTSAGRTRGADRMEAGVSVYTLDPGSGASPGRPGARETFALPYAAWSREGRTSLSARIGLVPLGADAGTVVTGELAVSTKADVGAFEARAYSRPRADSVLSFAGQKDAGGAAYGRVAETGLHIQGRIPAGKTYAIQAELSGAHLGGQNIPDNSMISGGLSASRSIERTGFAYLVTGPFYQFQSYDRNTNFYTPGHGGYFSPQSFQRAGWSANAQTDPLKDWILKGDAALAFESIEEDPAPVNPMLGSVQPLVGGSDSSGIAAALALSGARRITPEVILSANVSAIASAAYEDFRIGLAFTWVPGGRTGLVRTDLLADPFNPGSWIWP